jgi:HEAT repeat protein
MKSSTGVAPSLPSGWSPESDRNVSRPVSDAVIDLRAACLHPLAEPMLKPENQLQIAPTSPDIRPLLQDLRSPTPIVRLEAARALSLFGKAAAEATPLLIEEIKDPRNRRLAVSHLQALVLTLGEVGRRDGETYQALAGELGTPMVGEIARNALIEIGAGAIPHLLPALGGIRARAQHNAIMALGAIGAEVVGPLIKVLREGTSIERCNATTVLGGFGDQAVEALPALKTCARSWWRPSVFWAAREALRRIEASVVRPE